MLQPNVNGKYSLNTSLCPVIPSHSEVIVLHVFDFPATGTQFVTIKDANRTNLDRFGKEEPIISTIKLFDTTLVSVKCT